MQHNPLKAELLANPELKATYDALKSEFELLHPQLEARQAQENSMVTDYPYHRSPYHPNPA